MSEVTVNPRSFNTININSHYLLSCLLSAMRTGQGTLMFRARAEVGIIFLTPSLAPVTIEARCAISNSFTAIISTNKVAVLMHLLTDTDDQPITLFSKKAATPVLK